MSVSTGREVQEKREKRIGRRDEATDHRREHPPTPSDLTNHPHEEIVPYREFNVDGKLYYFTPGGFLYRKDPATGALGGRLLRLSHR
jgi:hypothetical protein